MKNDNKKGVKKTTAVVDVVDVVDVIDVVENDETYENDGAYFANCANCKNADIVSFLNQEGVLNHDDQVSYTESEKLVHNKQWEGNNIEDLLRSWGEKAAGLRWMHVHSANYWRTSDDRMNYAGITLSSIISASSLTGIAENFVEQHYVMLFIGLIGMLNMFNQSLQRFYRSSERAAIHETAAKQFGNFNRYVATKMSLSRQERGPPKQVLEFSLRENERLHKENPDPHVKSINAFKVEFGEQANNSEFSVPDFVTDTFKLRMYDEKCSAEDVVIDMNKSTNSKSITNTSPV